MKIELKGKRCLWPSLILALLIVVEGGAAAGLSPGSLSPARGANLGIPGSVLSELSLPITDKRYDSASLSYDKILARPVDASIIIASPPLKLDYSQYLTFTGSQDGWGGCIGRSIIHVLGMIKEMEHPYTPDLSFWYIDARQSQLINGGASDADITKTLLESYGICPEATLPSNYDHSKVKYDSSGKPYRDYSAMPQITDAINQEADLYKIKTFSEPQTPDVDSIKTLLIRYGPVIAGGAMPIVTGNKVDAVTGSVLSSDGTIQFTRDRPGEWTQVYSGKIINSASGLRLEGTFTHTGAAGDYPWNATLDQSYPNSARFWQPSPAAVPVINVTGRWKMIASEVSFDLDLQQSQGQIAGTMTCTSCEGHCITIVGYDDQAQAFKCLNSYGDTWNGNGFFILPYDEVKENLDSVRYFVNLFSDRSSSGQAFSARINIKAPLRNKLTVSIGAEGFDPEVVWDEPNRVECPDDSSTLCIDVPLPAYAASSWPPAEKQWYVEVTNHGQGTAKINELTLARLKSNAHCHSMGSFDTETYQAESLPEVPAGSTVRVYINGTGSDSGLYMAKLNVWYDLTMSQSVASSPGSGQKVALSGTLTEKSPFGEKLGSGKEIWIYRKADEQCVNMPDRWEKLGLAMTDAYGSFSYEASAGGTFAAALLDGDGTVLASSYEVSRVLPVQRVLVPQKIPSLEIPENPGPVEAQGELQSPPLESFKRRTVVAQTPLASAVRKINS
ncbi:MAG TPA: hypothetical protein VN455_01965 [Methanotrichaceae archaeon]|nr:hypothetical protein [Methanotrichaceae archaeon]